jgi:flagellar basal-body rod protein FlgB
MDLSRLPLFSALTRKLSWLSQRQKVLAQNISNADTPGYRPKDLKPVEFGRLVKSAARRIDVRLTNPLHLGRASQPDGGQSRAQVQRRTYEAAPDGNAVVLEEQMAKVAQTAVEFQLATNLYRKHVALLKTVLGRGSN